MAENHGFAGFFTDFGGGLSDLMSLEITNCAQESSQCAALIAATFIDYTLGQHHLLGM